jgi:hypothetical protein
VTVAFLPIAPRPLCGEAASSWIGRIGARYDIAADDLLTHVIGWRRSTVGAADRLDYHADFELEAALAMAVSVAPGTIGTLRIAGNDGSDSCWHRTAVVWCPQCIQGDRALRGEVHGRAIWRLGCCVLCPQHQVLLEDTCRRCAFEDRCDFRGSGGFLGLACKTCSRPVGPFPGRQGDAWQHEEPGPFGICLTASLNRLVLALQSDLQAALAGARPKRSWGFTRSAKGLVMAIFDLTLCVVFATRVRCEPRILLPEWSPGAAFIPVQEPVTLAALPLRAAYGVLALAAAALCSLEGGKRCHHWRPDGGGKVIMDAASLVAWLPVTIRGWLRSQAALWERPAGVALGSAIAAVEGGP